MTTVNMPYIVTFGGSNEFKMLPGESLEQARQRFLDSVDIQEMDLSNVDFAVSIDEQRLQDEMLNWFNQILKLSADSPEELRWNDVFRVMEEARQQGVLAEFRDWLIRSDIREETYDEVDRFMLVQGITDRLAALCENREHYDAVWAHAGCDLEEWLDDKQFDGDWGTDAWFQIVEPEFKKLLKRVDDEGAKAVHEARYNS